MRQNALEILFKMKFYVANKRSLFYHLDMGNIKGATFIAQFLSDRNWIIE
jgi:hypothetical protein